METRQVNEIGSRNILNERGQLVKIPVVKISLINPNPIDWMGKAHSYFTKKDRKLAKANHKKNAKSWSI